MGNKWFAESAQDAAAWGKQFFGMDKQPFVTVRVQVPNSVCVGRSLERIVLLAGAYDEALVSVLSTLWIST